MDQIFREDIRDEVEAHNEDPGAPRDNNDI